MENNNFVDNPILGETDEWVTYRYTVIDLPPFPYDSH